MESLRECFSKENNIWFNQTVACGLRAVGNFAFADRLFHQIIWKTSLALDASLTCEASMRFYNLLVGDSCFPLQAVDILSE